ncbi:peptidoglycan-binding domain-containing protein [Paraglaciecola arctica]|uniref:peptidoglycan-binding domain-containing protein n=1 Tax=Paraglaciecola arctica TaxID=1128911 RepID=UPI001C07988A|nr:peptidoglycan-binding domain-containing protein [Paraglaciecola arctica]MBU3004263.1 peptidoglycan-binding protein [Paraglaciecola arctica]
MSEDNTTPEQELGVEEGSPDPSAAATAATIPVPRAASGTETSSAVVLIQLEIFFQVYPGTSTQDGTNIGIADQPYQITFSNGNSSNGQTDADGKILITAPPGVTAQLRIFNTDYDVTARGSLEPITQLAGVQRRLQMVGYELGEHGVDGAIGQNTERAVLDLQYDAALNIDARGSVVNQQTRDMLSGADWAKE